MAGSSDGAGPAARFNRPYGLTWDGAGNLFIADTFNSTIRKLVVATGAVTTFAGTAGMAGFADGTGPAASFDYPWGVTSDGAGNLYVVDNGSYRIRKIVAATGVVTTLAGGPGGNIQDGIGTAAGFASPESIAFDGAGNLYVTDAQTVRKIVIATTGVTTVVGVAGPMGVLLGPFPAALNSPQGVAWLPNQGLLVSDYRENSILLARGL
jgi:sugar lactone lactonase YvrE